jgi:hypothetical protein
MLGIASPRELVRYVDTVVGPDVHPQDGPPQLHGSFPSCRCVQERLPDCADREVPSRVRTARARSAATSVRIVTVPAIPQF